jgi:hypothetical protein
VQGGNAAQQDAVDCWVSAEAASAHRSIGGLLACGLAMVVEQQTLKEGERVASCAWLR